MKKYFTILLASCVALTAFAGCGRGRGDNADELVIYAGEQWHSTDAANLNSFVGKFNEKYKETLGFEVKIVARTQIVTDLTGMLSSGQGGDLFILDRYSVPSYAADGVVNDWDKYLAKNELDLSQINADSLNESKYEGKQYAMPLDIDVWGLYVNSDLVDAYNATQSDDSKKLTSFDTWNDILKAGKALVSYNNGVMTRAGYSTADISQHYYSFLASASTDVFNAEGYVDFTNSQGMKDTLKFFREAKNSGIGQAGLEGQQNFTNEKLAIVHGSSYTKKYIESMNVGFDYTVYPQPKRGDGDSNSGLLGGYSFVLPAKSRKVEQADYDAKCNRAWAFVKTLLSDESVAREWMNTVGSYSPLESVWNDMDFADDKYFGVIKDYLGIAKARPSYSYFQVVQASYIVEDINTFLDGSDTVDTAAKNMDSRINSAIQAFKLMS